MLVWKILCVSNIVLNLFLALTMGLVCFTAIKNKKKKKNIQPVYKKYGSK